MGHRHHRYQHDDGQSTVEWLSVGAVIVGLVVALVALAPGLGGSLGERVSCLLQSVVGGSCDDDAAATAPGEPQDACVVASTEASVTVGGRIVVVDAEAGDAFIVETRSDGTTDVTFIDKGALGVSARLGGGASGDINGTGGGARAEAQVGIAGHGFIGETVRFDNPDDADSYIRDRITDEAIEAMPPLVEQAAQGGRWIIDQITGHERSKGQDVSSEGGVSIRAEGRGEGAIGPLRGELEGAAEAGARVKLLPDGTAEITVGVTRETSGSVGLIASLGGGGSAQGEVSVTLDPDGNPTAIAIRGTVAGEIQAGVDVLDLIEGADLPINHNPGRESVVEVSLDLTDPALADSADALIDQIGDGLTGDGSLDDVITAAGDLVDAGEDASTATVVVNDLDTSSISGGASGNLGIGVGLEGSGEVVDRELISASYWDPVQNRFVPWIRCTR